MRLVDLTSYLAGDVAAYRDKTEPGERYECARHVRDWIAGRIADDVVAGREVHRADEIFYAYRVWRRLANLHALAVRRRLDARLAALRLAGAGAR